MAGAYVWYFPEVGGTLEEIALSQPQWGDIQELPEVARAEAQAVAGTQAVSVYAHPMQVRLLFHFYGLDSTGLALARKIHTLQSHLDRGGVIWATNDRAKAWAGYTSTPYSRGSTSLKHGGRAWDFYTAATLASGDELVVQSFAPYCRREYTTASALGSLSLTLSAGLVYSYADAAFVRHRDFFCALRFPTGQRQRILTHDRRNRYTLDMTLEEDLPTIAAGSILQSGSLATPSNSGGKLTVVSGASFTRSPTGASSNKPTLNATPKRSG